VHEHLPPVAQAVGLVAAVVDDAAVASARRAPEPVVHVCDGSGHHLCV